MNVQEEISKLNRSHWPSYSRGLVRLGKRAAGSEEDLKKVLLAVRVIGDPYYRATTYASLAVEMKFRKNKDYIEIFDSALNELEQVDPEWRRAEALEWVSGKMVKAGIKDFSRVVSIFYSVRDIEKASDAAKAIIRNMGKAGSDSLLLMAELRLHDKERLDMLRAVANEIGRKKPGDLVKMDSSVNEMKEAFFRGKAWAYLGLKIGATDKDIGLAYFELALKDASVVEDDSQRLEILNYICDNIASSKVDAFDRILKARDSFTDKSKKARFLAHVAGKMNDAGDKTSLTVFDDAVASCSEITESADKAKALFGVAKGMKKSGLDQYEATTQMALECADEVKGEAGENLVMKIRRQIGDETGLETVVEDTREIEEVEEEELKMGRVLTLALFNTYDKAKMGSPHVRAIARAAPLCWAYNLDLAIVNFTFSSVEELVGAVEKDTQVGEGGKYLQMLDKNGRIHITEEPERLGTLVATTPNPDEKKNVPDVFGLEGDLCFMSGVGKLGLPPGYLNRAKYHLEFTGKKVPLETCTALGILSHILGTMHRM